MWKIIDDLITDLEEVNEGKTWCNVKEGMNGNEDFKEGKEQYFFSLYDDDNILYLIGMTDNKNDCDHILSYFGGLLGTTYLEFKDKLVNGELVETESERYLWGE